jgi:hypothetical protein
VLYCGNEKYGLLHLYAKGHDADWSAFTFPWMGNWRNLADYAISAALSYPRECTGRDHWPLDMEGAHRHLRKRRQDRYCLSNEHEVRFEHDK